MLVLKILYSDGGVFVKHTPVDCYICYYCTSVQKTSTKDQGECVIVIKGWWNTTYMYLRIPYGQAPPTHTSVHVRPVLTKNWEFFINRYILTCKMEETRPSKDGCQSTYSSRYPQTESGTHSLRHSTVYVRTYYVPRKASLAHSHPVPSRNDHLTFTARIRSFMFISMCFVTSKKKKKKHSAMQVINKVHV